MKIYMHCSPYLVRACEDVVRVFYPDAELLTAPEGADFSIRIEEQGNGVEEFFQASIITPQSAPEALHSAAPPPTHMPGEAVHNGLKRMANLAVKDVLEQYTGATAGPWGTLTGIRPTKLLHRLLNQNYTPAEGSQILADCYSLSPEKARLMQEVALCQRPFFHPSDQAGKFVSIYVGIPFCPTRCVYCSFPGYSLEKHSKLVEPFVQALVEEIRLTGKVLRKTGKLVETLYVGGGTPTSLSPSQVDRVLGALIKELEFQPTRENQPAVEFTVEAGRPDTINREMLEVLAFHGVNRLSINPQTMQETTLKTIGRAHTPEEVVQAVSLARTMGFDNINMDLIIGLPGEGVEQVAQTLEKLSPMQPENLTVHTLAVKRASALKEQRQDFRLTGGNEVAAMLELAYSHARQMGLQPYYLYRQKNILGHLENVGFAKPGRECVYNIQMMEERQTIIGLGCGSASKWVDPTTWYLKGTYNPKDPLNYIQRIQEITDKKAELIRQSIP